MHEIKSNTNKQKSRYYRLIAGLRKNWLFLKYEFNFNYESIIIKGSFTVEIILLSIDSKSIYPLSFQ